MNYSDCMPAAEPPANEPPTIEDILAASEAPPKPEVRLDGGEFDAQVSATIEALSRHPNVYQRGRALVSIDRGAARLTRKTERTPDAPAICPLSPEHLAPMLTTVATFRRHVNGKDRDVRPDQTLVRAVLGGAPGEPHTWPGIRVLEGVLECPAFMRDGSILATDGYDQQSGYVLASSMRITPVPERPTQQDARAALERLLESLQDFPHAGEDQKGDRVCGPARSVWLAALLTLLARPAIRGAVPAFFFDATCRGSGKSLQADLLAIIARGGPAARATWTDDETELEKVLGGLAIAGDGLVVFDNVARPWGGAPLDKVLTAVDTVKLRVLGRSEFPALPWRAVVIGTGNNVCFTGDASRRTLVSRLESLHESPETRTDFRIPGGADGLRQSVRRKRAHLVRDALTVLRAWHVAGRPVARTFGGYEAWSIVPAAIVWAGGADPIDCFASMDADTVDPDKAALAAWLEHAPRAEAYLEGNPGGQPSGRGVLLKAIVDLLYPNRPPGDDGPSAEGDGWEALREAVEHAAPRRGARQPEVGKLGLWVRDHRGRVLNGRKIVLAKAASKRGSRWTVATSKPAAPPPSAASAPPEPPAPETPSDDIERDAIQHEHL